MRLLFSTLALVATLSTASAEALTLATTYDVAGINPDGSKYTGTLSVKLLSDTTFAVNWNIDGTIYKGFGMRRGDVLSATYTIDGDPGLVMYQVDGNGLDGSWAIRGKDGVGTEHLTPAK